ncbi:MAG: ATP-binding protein [Rhodospirillales bacterium]|nr:ATP-binding protein [Rhodospirillales bacterium]
MGGPDRDIGGANAADIRRQAGRWTSVPLLAAGFGAVLLLMFAVIGAGLHASYRDAIRRHEQAAHNAAHALLQFTDVTMRQARRALGSLSVDPRAPGIVLPHDADELLDVLRRANLASLGFQGIGVVDSAGRLFATSYGPVVPPADVRDRDYFVHHRDSADRGLRIGAPMVGRATGTRLIPISLRLEDAAGGFSGLVSVLVEPSYFESFMETLGVDGATLFSSDGTVIARVPAGDRFVGQSIRRDGYLMSVAGRTRDGTFRAVSSLDGIARLYGYRVSQDHPVFATAAFDEQVVLAAWREELYRTLALMVLLSAIYIAFSVFAIRRVRRDAALADEARAARAQAERAMRDAEAANRAKGAFLAHMSHELRTPLNAILGFSEMVRDGFAGPVGARANVYVGHINDSGQHLLSLIDDLLHLAPAEGPRQPLAREETDLHETVEQAVARLAEETARRRVRVRLAAKADGKLPLNRRALHQIVANLLSNAVRHSPDGGRVDVSVRRDGTQVEIAIADEGPGMPAELAARVGEPFLVHDDPTTAAAGIGIGLAVVKSLVDRLDGTLAVRAGETGGTIAIVRLPVPA